MNERIQPSCEKCSEPVDIFQPGIWKSADDQRWYHKDCYDEVEQVEKIYNQIQLLTISGSDEFHDELDKAKKIIGMAITKEKLKREQKLGHYK